MSKKTLMIDLDQVITDGTWKEQIEEFLNRKIDLEKTGYYLENALGSRKEEFYQTQSEINMYKNAELMPNAYDVLKELNQKYELYIVSSYNLADIPNRAGEHLKTKYEFIYQELPFIKQEQIVLINNKKLCKFDIGIDDKINNLASSTYKILYRSWHNRDIQSNCDAIVNNWIDIKNILLESDEHGKITKNNSQ